MEMLSQWQEDWIVSQISTSNFHRTLLYLFFLVVICSPRDIHVILRNLHPMERQDLTRLADIGLNVSNSIDR